MKIVNVVLTGGVGSRLWPLSRKNKPKQYLNLVEGKSLFQQTILRNRKICDELMIIGNVDNYTLSRSSLEDLRIEKYKEIIEATPRNTAAAIAFGAMALDKEDIMFVTPSDHLIEDDEVYQYAVNQAIDLAKKDNVVTFGLKPTKPETGYGYIHIEGNKVLGFREKPNKDTAEEFLKAGNFYWNSGMFCFKVKVFLDELKKYAPKVLEKAKEAFNNIQDNFLPLEESLKIPSISVDYAIMERTKRLQAVIGTFYWSDMGSFESIYEYYQSKGYKVDNKGNMVIGTQLHTEFLGLEDCILVHTDDVILILRREKVQDVKGIYERLEKENPSLV